MKEKEHWLALTMPSTQKNKKKQNNICLRQHFTFHCYTLQFSLCKSVSIKTRAIDYYFLTKQFTTAFHDHFTARYATKIILL